MFMATEEPKFRMFTETNKSTAFQQMVFLEEPQLSIKYKQENKQLLLTHKDKYLVLVQKKSLAIHSFMRPIFAYQMEDAKF